MNGINLRLSRVLALGVILALFVFYVHMNRILSPQALSHFSLISHDEHYPFYDVLDRLGEVQYWVKFVPLYFLLTAIFGCLSFWPLFKKINANAFTLLVMGFLPGYWLQSGLNRGLTLFLPHRVAPITCIAIVMILCVVLLFARRRSLFHSDKTARERILHFLFSLLFVPLWVFAFKAAAAINAFNNSHLWAGDGVRFMWDYVSQWIESPRPDAYLPLVSQHYDELSYLYPLFFGALTNTIPVLTFWILSVPGKLSALCLTYGFFRLAKLSFIQSWVSTAFLFFGTFFLDPRKMNFYFDSENPLLWVLNLGKYTPLLLPPLFLCYVFLTRPKLNLVNGLILFLLGIGLSSTSFHGVGISAVLISIFYISYRLGVAKNLNPAKTYLKYVVYASSVVFVFITLNSLSNIGKRGSEIFFFSHGGLVWLSLLISAAFCFHPFIATRIRYDFSIRSSWPIATFLSGLFSGALFLGNIVTFKFFNLWQSIKWFPPAFSENPLTRFEYTPSAGNNLFSWRQCKDIPEHCRSYWHFFGFYTIPFLVFISLGYFLLKKINDYPFTKDKKLLKAFYSLYWPLISLTVVGFLFIDYLNLGVFRFVFSRILETPFYLLFATLFIVIFRYLPTPKRAIAIGLILIWTYYPMKFNGRLHQFRMNNRFLNKTIWMIKSKLKENAHEETSN